MPCRGPRTPQSIIRRKSRHELKTQLKYAGVDAARAQAYKAFNIAAEPAPILPWTAVAAAPRVVELISAAEAAPPFAHLAPWDAVETAPCFAEESAPTRASKRKAAAAAPRTEAEKAVETASQTSFRRAVESVPRPRFSWSTEREVHWNETTRVAILVARAKSSAR